MGSDKTAAKDDVESFIRARLQWIRNLTNLYGDNGSARIIQYQSEINMARNYGAEYLARRPVPWTGSLGEPEGSSTKNIDTASIELKCTACGGSGVVSRLVDSGGDTRYEDISLKCDHCGGSGAAIQSLPIDLTRYPTLLLQTEILDIGDSTQHGSLVASVRIAWYEIFEEIERCPEFIYQFAKYPRRLEEFIAGAYERAGWQIVELTPRSGDGGRDIIVSRTGFGALRFLEQVKAYSPGTLVTHDHVRSMLGVLYSDQNASKAIITTTSDFQPRITEEFKQFIPNRLELKNGKQLRQWLKSIPTR